MPEPTQPTDRSDWCLFCPHVAERHCQSDDSVYCMLCRMDCYTPDDIDDSRWIGVWHAPERD